MAPAAMRESLSPPSRLHRPLQPKTRALSGWKPSLTRCASSSTRWRKRNRRNPPRLTKPGRVERRLAVAVALQEAHSFAAEDFRLLLSLDTLGDRGEAEPFRQTDQMAQEHLALAARRDVANK